MNDDAIYETPIFVRRVGENGYLAHRAVYAAMGEPNKDLQRDFIFDLESIAMEDGNFVVVRSARMPRGGVGSRVELPAEDEYAFHLRAVPLRGSSKRGGIDSDPGRLFWLDRQAALNGFRIQGTPQMTVRSRHFFNRNEHLTVLETRFEGRLAVVDRGKFQAAWLNGVGRKRGFGFGMLHLSDISAKDN